MRPPATIPRKPPAALAKLVIDVSLASVLANVDLRGIIQVRRVLALRLHRLIAGSWVQVNGG